MRKLILTMVLILGLPVISAAQVVPRITLFGGYTFVRAQTDSGTGIAGTNFNLNGWDASIEGGLAPWLGMVADVSQQYGSPFGYQEKQTTLLFGPQINIHGIPHVMPFAHALVGAVHGTDSVSVPGFPLASIATGNAFATALGGGFDLKIFGPLWIRPVQVDWLHGNLSPDHHTQFRLASGISLHFGGL